MAALCSFMEHSNHSGPMWPSSGAGLPAQSSSRQGPQAVSYPGGQTSISPSRSCCSYRRGPLLVTGSAVQGMAGHCSLPWAGRKVDLSLHMGHWGVLQDSVWLPAGLALHTLSVSKCWVQQERKRCWGASVRVGQAGKSRSSVVGWVASWFCNWSLEP